MSLGKDAYHDYVPAGKEEGYFPLVENGRVLEIGFGGGKLLEALRARGNDVYGVDASISLVESVKARGFEHVYHGDMSEEPLPWPDDFFDAVYAYEVFEHLTNPHRLFYEARRVLKRDHPFFFSVPCQERDMGYGLGLHPFVYPGLLVREHLERFIMQMYFRIDGYVETGHMLEGRSYHLCNKKDPAKPDIVYVVPRTNNVRELYSEVLTPEALDREIAREAGHLCFLARAHTERNDLVQVRELLRHATQEYPDYHPMYIEFARCFARLGHNEIALNLLELLVKRQGEVSPALCAEAQQAATEIQSAGM